MLEMAIKQDVHIPLEGVTLEGALVLPEQAHGMVVFAHGSGSSRHSPRNNFVAGVLQAEGIGTLLTDLLTRQEDLVYETRFDIQLLTERLIMVTEWVSNQKLIKGLPIGYFGASTGAAAAINAAAYSRDRVKAVVSRGGRPDMAMQTLPKISMPVLLIVGGNDEVVIELNRKAYDQINAQKEMIIIPGASHLFEEPGTLDQAAALAARWFKTHLR